MKDKLSISIESETISEINELLKEGIFRNKSHFIEYCINKLLKEKKNE